MDEKSYLASLNWNISQAVDIWYHKSSDKLDDSDIERTQWLKGVESTVIDHVRRKRYGKPVVIKNHWSDAEFDIRSKMLFDWATKNKMSVTVNKVYTYWCTSKIKNWYIDLQRNP